MHIIIENLGNTEKQKERKGTHMYHIEVTLVHQAFYFAKMYIIVIKNW